MSSYQPHYCLKIKLKLPKVTAVNSRHDSQTIAHDRKAKHLPQTWLGIHFFHLFIPHWDPPTSKGVQVNLGHKRSAYLKQLQLLETALLGDKSQFKLAREQGSCLRGPGWAKTCEPQQHWQISELSFFCQHSHSSWLRISPQGEEKWESHTHVFCMDIYAYLCNCSNFSFLWLPELKQEVETQTISPTRQPTQRAKQNPKYTRAASCLHITLLTLCAYVILANRMKTIGNKM